MRWYSDRAVSPAGSLLIDQIMREGRGCSGDDACLLYAGLMQVLIDIGDSYISFSDDDSVHSPTAECEFTFSRPVRRPSGVAYTQTARSQRARIVETVM